MGDTTSFLDSLDDTALFAELDSLASGGQVLSIHEETVGESSTDTTEESSSNDIPTEESVIEDTVETGVETESTDDTTQEDGSIVQDETTPVEQESENTFTQQEFDELKTFRDSFDNTVKVDGVDIPLTKDPEQLVQMHKKYYAMQDKLDKFKEVTPVFDTLQDSGILKDSTKLATLIEASKGNPEAIKMLMQQHNIDPLTLDLTNIEEGKVTDKVGEYVDTKEVTALKDIYSDAKSRDVGDTFVKEVYNEWDSDSLLELTKNQDNAEAILQHLESGAFDEISKEVKILERTDSSFRSKNSFDKYLQANENIYEREVAKANASKELQAISEKHRETPVNQVQQEEPVQQEDTTNERILSAQKAATQASMRGETVSTSDQSVDSMDDKELIDFFNSVITN